ncbi:MAG: hypothetical protein Q7S87_09085 [Agitococcus sp.]|nr:hypothetical protein [Agitococcus sp.]MDO9177055.1 hypothetical protein [Agitococcus sp.]
MRPSYHAVLAAIEPAFIADDAAQFMAGVKHGYQTLRQQIVAAPRQKKGVKSVLTEAFAATKGDIRRRKILELCAWPIFDKPAIASAAAKPTEFLWLFAVPFTVTLAQSTESYAMDLSGELFDGSAFLAEMTKVLSPSDSVALRVVPTLFSRDDFHRYGPQNIAKSLMDAEEGFEALPIPYTIEVDAEYPTNQCFSFFVLCAARCSLGVTAIFAKQPQWQDALLADMVKSGLTDKGLNLVNVEGHAPCPIMECLFKCSGIGFVELELNLRCAQASYPGLEVFIQHPMEGFAEINAKLPTGDTIHLMPPFSYVEPPAELDIAIESICSYLSIPFQGTFVVPMSFSRLMH